MGYEFGFVPLNDDVSASVNSVFGRTGAVAASVGDYTAAQVTNAANLIAGGTQTFAGPLAAPSASVSGIVTATSFASAPIASASVTASFGSVTIGTPKQNTLGYDILVSLAIVVTAATSATFVAGVGPSSSPPTSAVTASFSAAANQTFDLTFIVPNNYYLLVNDTGTITVGSTTTWVQAV